MQAIPSLAIPTGQVATHSPVFEISKLGDSHKWNSVDFSKNIKKIIPRINIRAINSFGL